MNDFTGMEELLQDFLLEASDLLADVDSKLMDLEKSPNDKNYSECDLSADSTRSKAARDF